MQMQFHLQKKPAIPLDAGLKKKGRKRRRKEKTTGKKMLITQLSIIV